MSGTAQDDASAFVSGSELLIARFGFWPSFHDAEILSIVLDRDGPLGASLTATIHVFEMTDRVNSKGYYVLRNHSLATFTFDGIALDALKWFNEQNVLWDLELTGIDPPGPEGQSIAVSMPSSHGCDAVFSCKRVTLKSVLPFVPSGFESSGDDGPAT